MFFPLIASFIVSLFDHIALLCAYVSTGSAFPSPLSSQDEAKYLRAMERGEQHARNILIERNLRLVAHVVKKFENTQEDADDLISIGTIGLIKAIQTFDRHKNTRLATYAARCIENEILMHLRANKRTRSEMRLFEPIGADKDGNEISLMDILESDIDIEDDITRRAERQAVLQKIQSLGGRERTVLELRYGLHDGLRKTQREISKVLGISRSYVSRIEKRALMKLQNGLVADGY